MPRRSSGFPEIPDLVQAVQAPIWSYDPATSNTQSVAEAPPAMTLDTIRNGVRVLQEHEENMRRDAVRRIADVRIEHDYQHDQTLVDTRLVGHLNYRSAIRARDLEELNTVSVRSIARQHAAALTRELENQIFDSLAQALDRANRERYAGPGRLRGWLTHGVDLAAGAVNAVIDKEHVGAFEWLANFEHKTIESQGWVATVLDSAEAVKAEGDDMSHCLGRSYVGRIARGEYMAIHIVAPKGSKYPRSGFTLGFHRRADGILHYDQIKGKKNSTHWVQDELLLHFVRHVENTIKEKQVKVYATGQSSDYAGQQSSE